MVGDILDVARNMVYGCTGRIGCSCYYDLPIKEMLDTVSSYYIRMKLEDRAGTLAELAGVFGKNGVSISMLIQKAKEGDTAEVVIVSYDVKERQFRDSLATISAMPMVKEISSVIRVHQA